MSDQPDTPTLRQAVTTHYAAAGREPRGAMLRITTLDERHERLEAERHKSPDFYASLGTAAHMEHAIYMDSSMHAARQFRWDPERELQLQQQAAGATFAGEEERALAAYQSHRDIAEARGMLEAARKAAEKGDDD